MINPVLIVGAGPVGLSAGVALARAGIPIRIIDRLITPTNQSRAAIVHARTLEHFERLGFAEDFLAAGVKVRGAAIYGPGNKLLIRPSLGLQAIVRGRFGADVPLYDPVWISPFGINTRMAPTMRRGRIFLAGDAAHVHSPVGGQGMNTGIQDALNLTWKFALVLRGAAKPELLDSYNAERHANARKLLARVGPATKMASLRHPVAIEVRNWLIHLLGELGFSHAMPRIVSMLDVAYPDSPIVGEAHTRWLSRGPHAGDRAPDADGLLCAGQPEPQRLFTIWSGNDRHQLLHFAASDASCFPISSLYAITRIVREGTPSDGVIVDTEGHAHEAYSVGKPGPCFLVRPDGVIAFRSGEPDATALLEYLGKWYPSV